MTVEKSGTSSMPPFALLPQLSPWPFCSPVCPPPLPVFSPILPPLLLVRPLVLQPRCTAVDRPALRVVILGGIIYMREDIGNIRTMARVDINTLTMEQYLALLRENQASAVVKPEIRGNVNFEIKISQDTVLLRVLPFSLTGSAKRWVDRLTLGAVNTWDLLKKAFIQRFEHYEPLIVDSQGPIPGMTPTQALTIIQTMADHSQKWNDWTSSRNISSISNTEGIAAIVSKLDNLGHNMKKLKENVHAIQVGCQICEGPHLDIECPLNEEVKPVEEVKYGEFGRPAPFNGSNGAKFCVGPPGYYTRTDSRPPYGEKRPILEELMTKHQEESTRRSAKMEK
ncbi:hypothetical protein Tco_0512418 [Tanacetum coccineum]